MSEDSYLFNCNITKEIVSRRGNRNQTMVKKPILIVSPVYLIMVRILIILLCILIQA